MLKTVMLYNAWRERRQREQQNLLVQVGVAHAASDVCTEGREPTYQGGVEEARFVQA